MLDGPTDVARRSSKAKAAAAADMGEREAGEDIFLQIGLWIRTLRHPGGREDQGWADPVDRPAIVGLLGRV